MTSEFVRAGDFPVTAKQIFFLVTVSSSCLVLGSMNGWTAVLPRLQEDRTRFTVTDEEVAWLVSMTSLVMMAFSLVTGPLVEWLGPRRLLQLSLFLDAISWLLIALTPYKSLLYLGRAGLATATTFIVTLVQPFVAEMSSTKTRGMASTGPDLNGAIGVLLAFLLASFTSWNVATILCTLPPLLLFVPSFFVPESPYWLVRRGRMEDAKVSLRKLMGPKANVEVELAALTSASATTQTSIREQFVALRKGRNVRPVAVVLVLFVLRELGGRSAIFMYSVYIFQRANVNLDPFICTVLLGVSRVLFSGVSAVNLDRVGRRPMLLGSTLVCGLSQLLAGLFLYLEVPGASWIPLVAILVYMGSYGLGLGPIPWVLMGEMIPSPVRSLGASVIIFINYVAVFGVNYAFLKVMSSLGLGETIAIFGVITFLACVVVWQWVPETRGISLQELEHAFSSRSRKQQQHLMEVASEEKSALAHSIDKIEK